MLFEFHQALRDVPELLFAVKAAASVFVSGIPIFAGLRYFMYRRKLVPSWGFVGSFVGVFAGSAALAFLFASPFAKYVPLWAIRPFLFITAILSAYAALELIDLFFVHHYLLSVRHVYISPPIRTVAKIVVFGVLLIPILHYALAFNPLTLVAIPTVLTAGIAFAMQDTIKSALAGIGLGNIMHVGQWISVQNNLGRVVDITWSRTVLVNGDGNYVYIPNSQLQNQIVLNYKANIPPSQFIFKVGITYDTPPARVKDIVAKALVGTVGLAAAPAPFVNVLEFGDSAIQYNVFFWAQDFTQGGNVKDDVAGRLWDAFRKEHIEIAHPIRTVHLETSEPTAPAHS